MVGSVFVYGPCLDTSVNALEQWLLLQYSDAQSMMRYDA